MSWKPGLTKVYVLIKDESLGDPSYVVGVYVSRKAALKASQGASFYSIEEHDLTYVEG